MISHNKLDKVNCPFGLLVSSEEGVFSISLSLFCFGFSLFLGTGKCCFDGLFGWFWFDVLNSSVGCFGCISDCLVGV